MNDIYWNKINLEEFKALALLTDFELLVLETKIKGWSRTKQAFELNCSTSTIDRTIKQIRNSYCEL